MGRKNIRIEIKHRISPQEPGIYRLALEIVEVRETLTDTVLNNRLFLISKPQDTPGEISVKDAGYLNIAPVGIYNLFFKKMYGDSHSAPWEDLPQVVPVYTPETHIDDGTVPSDAALGDFVEDRYLTSAVLVFEDSAPAIFSIFSAIMKDIKLFNDTYGQYAAITTAFDDNMYPSGWEEVSI